MFAVGTRDVAADPDRPLGPQTRLALATTAGVGEVAGRAILGPPREHAVGNQLFERRVFLNARPGPPRRVPRVEQEWQVAGGVATEALEDPRPLKERPRHDKNIFLGNRAHEVSPWVVSKPLL